MRVDLAIWWLGEWRGDRGSFQETRCRASLQGEREEEVEDVGFLGKFHRVDLEELVFHRVDLEEKKLVEYLTSIELSPQ